MLYRWIRPDKRNRAYQWSHGTNSATKKATTEYIADELRAGRKPVRLYFANAQALRSSVIKRAAATGVSAEELDTLSDSGFVAMLERFLIHRFQPAWNVQSKSRPPAGVLGACGAFWVV